MRRLAALVPIVLGLLLGGCRLLEGGIRVEEAWARPALAGSNSVVYFRLINRGPSDRLVGVRADAASQAAVHRTRTDAQGMMHMEMQETVELPADSEIVFEPGGLHVMLIGLTRDLLLDEQTSITLVLEEAGEVTIEVPIESR